MARRHERRWEFINWLADRALIKAEEERRWRNAVVENKAYRTFMYDLQGDEDCQQHTTDVKELFEKMYEAGDTTVTDKVRNLFDEYWRFKR